MSEPRFDVPPPTSDWCWEGRLGSTITMLCILYIFMSLRVKAVHRLYSNISARGISGAFVMAATVLCTVYTSMVIWNYTVWYRIRGLYEHSLNIPDENQANELLPILRSLIPSNRREVAFAMRMMLVTVLWLVKGSFILVYYAFAPQLPRGTRYLLYGTTAALLASYIAVWSITGFDMKVAIELEGYSPVAGAGVALFTPPNTWSTWTVSEDVLRGRHDEVPSLLTVEIVITSLNAGTDLLLLILVYFIFRYLNLARGRNHFRSMLLLLTLSSLSIVIAAFRLGIMLSGMKAINFRLAFDSLTEFEAFVAACAACIPAMRVLARGGGNKLEFGFPENWGFSRFSIKSMQSLRGHTRDGRESFVSRGGELCVEKITTVDKLVVNPVPMQKGWIIDPDRPGTARTNSDWDVESGSMPIVK
ncbi:hypothetical protein BDD12DRAFT_845221 [Trichophaea hybrida]|nr:hypothetical protein BDD12DRAFT_845221 [Trichophaea hybrida]